MESIVSYHNDNKLKFQIKKNILEAKYESKKIDNILYLTHNGKTYITNDVYSDIIPNLIENDVIYLDKDITVDTVLNKKKVTYVLKKNISIMKNITLKAERDVKIQGDGFSIKVLGTLDFVGEKKHPVSIENLNVSPGKNTRFDPLFLINLQNCKINGGTIYAPTGNAIFGSLSIKNCIVKNMKKYMYLWYPRADCYIEGNTFENSGGIVTLMDWGLKAYIRNNVFKDQFLNYAVESQVNNKGAETIVEYNSFMDTDKIVIKIAPSYKTAKLTAKYNFWNTTNINVINKMIYDKKDNIKCASEVDYSDFLHEIPR